MKNKQYTIFRMFSKASIQFYTEPNIYIKYIKNIA